MDPWSRVHIIDQLGSMPTRRVLECIARFVHDENEMVQEAAIAALQTAGIPVDLGSSITGDEQTDKRIEDGF